MMTGSIRVNQQKGAALAVSLVILLIMTIIGLQGISSTTLEERMSRNYRDTQMSFQAAEAALRDAEYFIDATLLKMGDFSTTCANGLCFHPVTAGTCPPTTLSPPPWKDFTNIWNNPANHRVYSGTIVNVYAKPKFIIEFRCYVPIDANGATPSGSGPGPGWAEMYRITALGYGASDTSRTMLQSTYKKF